MRRHRKKNPVQKDEKPSIIGLLALGAIGTGFGLLMAFKPIPYSNPGGLGRAGANGPMTIFSSSDASLVGWLIFACGSFCLYLAYRVRKS